MTPGESLTEFMMGRGGNPEAFTDETAAPPLKGHHYLDTTWPEVSPQELLAIAAPLAANGSPAKDAISRAYELITEARLFCRNVAHWNSQVRRNHVDLSIGNALKKVPSLERTAVVVALLNEIGETMNDTDAEKLFNEWYRYKLRERDFLANSPYSSILRGSQEWNPHWLNLPDKRKPETPAPRKTIEGEHETVPWWTTDDVWWPEPSEESLKAEKSADLEKGTAKGGKIKFKSEHTARQLLQNFLSWVKNRPTSDSPSKGPNRRRSRTAGVFVSPKTNGAVQGDDGRFRKKSSS